MVIVGNQAVSGPAGQDGATGAQGPAGPNSVTSATSSDYTCDLKLASLETGTISITDGFYVSTLDIILDNGVNDAFKDALEIASADIIDATDNGDTNKEKILKTNDEGQVTVTSLAAQVVACTSQFAIFNGSNLALIKADFLTDTRNLQQPNASGSYALTASTTGIPDKLTDGTIAGTLTIDSTSYTYGTGAASAHRTALGLTALATTTPAANVTAFLETPSSANLAAAITNETGSGSLVFATTPTLNNPTASTSSTSTAALTVTGGTSTVDLLRLVATSDATFASVGFIDRNGVSRGSFGYAGTTAIAFSNTVFFTATGGSRMLFSTTGTERMTIAATGEIGVGTASPSTKAMLDLTSTTKGFLPPRMTTTQRDAISAPPAGLMVYNSTTNKLNFYNGSAWEAVTSAATSITWDYLVANWSSEPTLNAAISGGEVYDYTLSGVTRYRFVPTTYDPTQDAFYSTYESETLSNLIATRG